MKNNLGELLKGKPIWMRLLILLSLILAAGTRCYVGTQQLEARSRPVPTYCVAEDPVRVEYLSVDGLWSETSAPDSVRAVVYRSAGETVDRRVIDMPESWELGSVSAAQKTGLEPYTAGGYLMMMYPPSECFTGTSAKR